MDGDEFDERVDFFDQMATTSWLSEIHDEFLKEIGSWEEKRVLDVGCGTGRLLQKGASLTTEVYGIDLSKKMVQRTEELLSDISFIKQPSVQVGDAECLPYKDEIFDIVCSTCVVFLIPNAKWVLKEMSRVLKPGGNLALINPSTKLDIIRAKELSSQLNLAGIEKDSLLQWGRISERRHQFSVEEFEMLLKEVGFRIVTQKTFYNDISLITIAKK
ncbi:class I SAM-dependent methyltransferase [Bacillus shivajii]|uniref:class I SAM-dependent methyltransferase n=1 Tax=Bacillus shivajii TaxID=1983719 RepID=UPI001CFAEC1D|nr:class I SAM-dependent methyltransferase [Bacillus shivajii]UCZ55336.1 class I SAM-dependent methyltransferase [Bacillus shivajii]